MCFVQVGRKIRETSMGTENQQTAGPLFNVLFSVMLLRKWCCEYFIQLKDSWDQNVILYEDDIK